MYYHPHMFNWANGQRTFAACQAFIGVCLDGVMRQQQARADAVSVLCGRRGEEMRMVITARDPAQFVAGLLACAGRGPHGRANSHGLPESWLTRIESEAR